MSRPTMIAITGAAKDLTREEKWIIYNAVKDMVEHSGGAAQWLSGGARGVDVYAAEAAIRLDQEAQHHLYFPTWKPNPSAPPVPLERDRKAISHLTKLAAELGVYMKWHWADAGVGPKKNVGYLRRDDILAVNCTHMAAWPRTAEETQRSGTWATVRRGHRLERPTMIYPLDGSAPYRYKG